MSAGTSDSGSDHPRPRAEWSRVADGVGLAGLGVFFLLATSRGLPEGFWVDAVSFWPVLLVSAGIRIVFEKTSLAFGVLLGPAVVLGTLFWLAWGDRSHLPVPDKWETVSVNRPEHVDRAKVLLNVGGVRVDLDTRSLSNALLAEGRAAARGKLTPLRLTQKEGEATLRLKSRRRDFITIGPRHETWELGVRDDLPVSLDVGTGAMHGDFDLRRGHAADSEVSGAFNAVILRLPRTREHVTITLEGAFNSFEVLVPERTSVRYDGPGFPLGWVDQGPAEHGLADGAPGYRVVLDGAFNSLDIAEGPPPEGGWSEPFPPMERPKDEDELRKEAETPSLPAETEPDLPAEDPDGAPVPEALPAPDGIRPPAP